MYQIPSEADLRFLIGRELVQVCIGQSHVILQFYGDISISIEREFNLEPYKLGSSMPECGSQLLAALGGKIVGIEVVAPDHLTIAFDTVGRLHIFAVDDGYESFTISSPEGILVI